MVNVVVVEEAVVRVHVDVPLLGGHVPFCVGVAAGESFSRILVSQL